MRFIRFVLARRHSDSGLEDGAFGLAYELRDSPDVETADRDLLAETLAWFGIAWFKDSATEHLARMHQIKMVLEQYGHPVVMLSEPRVGYVTYEDAFQVIAEPFSDTQTG